MPPAADDDARLSEEGMRAADGGDWALAERAFDGVLANEPLHVAASLGKLRCLANAESARSNEADALAEALIDRYPAHSVARYSERGKQCLATLELAHNTLAWNELHRTRTNEGLLAALAMAKRGLRLDHRRPDWLINTTVRIMLALGRPDDAFTLIRDAERRFPNTSLFGDLAEPRGAWKLTRTRAHDGRAITTSFQKKARSSETYAEIINRANRWLRALYDTGHQTLVEIEFGDTDIALRRVHEPIAPSAVRELEEQLGFSLPPSYARFLTEVGGLAFLNDWWDETTAPSNVVESSRALAEIAMPGDLVWQAAGEHLGLVRVCDFHNGEDWIYLCHWRDHRGESPTFLRYHDEGELYYGFDPPALDAVVAGVPGAKKTPRRTGPSSAIVSDAEPAATNIDLVAALGEALADESLSQRDKVNLVKSEWSERLADASDDDVLAALHLIRGRIKSKKLRSERDALLLTHRRDGLAGDAPLPSLPESRRPEKDTSKAEVPEFDTFHRWLSDRVDEMMDIVIDRVTGPA